MYSYREYDRRAVNGASFICFGQRILTADEPRCQELINYQKRVITALGIKHGPTHGEVKWFQGKLLKCCHSPITLTQDSCYGIFYLNFRVL